MPKYDHSIPCTRCITACAAYEHIGGGHRWCTSCVAEHADLGQLLAALQARGLCFRQAKTPGEYLLDREVNRFPHLLTALGRHRVEVKAMLRQGITARFGPLLDWAPCQVCGELVHVDQAGQLGRHRMADGQTWCAEESPAREVAV